MQQKLLDDVDYRLAEAALLYRTGFLGAGVLAELLRDCGQPLDAGFLELAPRGPGPHRLHRPPFTGRRLWTGAVPPGEAAPGDVWFDTVELGASLLVPRTRDLPGGVSRSVGEPWGWISLQPVRWWQLLRFDAAARVRWRPEYEGLHRFRNRRWQGFGRLRHAGGLIHAEGRAYAAWLSKELPPARAHNALYLMLPPEGHGCLAGGGRRLWEEWSSDAGSAGRRGVVTHRSWLGIDPGHLRKAEAFSGRRLVRTWLGCGRASEIRAGCFSPPAEPEFALGSVLVRRGRG